MEDYVQSGYNSDECEDNEEEARNFTLEDSQEKWLPDIEVTSTWEVRIYIDGNYRSLYRSDYFGLYDLGDSTYRDVTVLEGTDNSPEKIYWQRSTGLLGYTSNDTLWIRK